jgi:hypothetical protein
VTTLVDDDHCPGVGQPEDTGRLQVRGVVEGIATNGSDIWIVDAQSDKVYKYAGAASSPSGSQSVTSARPSGALR